MNFQSKQYSAIVCSFIWPLSPGHSGGEIRDFHLIKRLTAIAAVKFISMTDANPKGREHSLGSFVEQFYEPGILQSRFPQFINKRALRRSWFSRLIGLLRMLNIPVWGLKYHRDISLVSYQIDAYVLPVLRHLLQMESPDYLFITPQLNPTLLQLNANVSAQTRTILLTYDVEAVRISRLAEAHKGLSGYAWRLETFRAERFERENIRLFDGVIAVSELDRMIMIERYGLDSERVLTIENSVDVDYFSFKQRVVNTDRPNIVFVGNLAYWPNHDAAIRLLREIMPRIRSFNPIVRAWVVGDKPSHELEALANSDLSFITGSVDDVRPYLQQASVVCIPLRAGSGTKYKVLEALCAGTPVVCTSIAAEGLDLQSGTHFLVADSDEELADACIQILKQPERYQDMAGRARQQIERYYSWERNLEKLDAWLDQIKQMPIKRESKS
jgi:glycosyltransferase involved in cell wall biosynthesis